MIAVVQRTTEAEVTIGNRAKGKIALGLVVLLGIEEKDTREDTEWLCNKIVNLRIFNDDDGLMNKSLIDVDGELMVISQFTLHASTRKGNRPSYIKAAKPDIAIPLYEQFVALSAQKLGKRIKTGEFGAMMQVRLTNDGPVTIIIDTKDKK